MSNSDTPIDRAKQVSSTSSLANTGLRISQVHVFRSEWIKLRSLKSTTITLFIAVVLFIGFGVLGSYFTVARWDRLDAFEKLIFDPVRTSLIGVFLAQLAVGVLGVLFITSEYSSGMIRASLAAVPRRLPVLWAKITIFGMATFALMLIAAFGAFFISQAILATSTHDLATTIDSPGVFRAVVGAAGYLLLIGLIGIALGALTRSTAGGISTLAGILFVMPILVNVLPQSWNDTISPYFPSRLGASLFSLNTFDTNSLTPGAALIVMIGYVVILLTASAIQFVRRDA